RVEKDSGALLLEGIRRLDAYNELLDALPALNQVYEANLGALSSAHEFPDEVARILRLFDGMRSLRDVTDGSPVDDVTTLRIVRKLIDDNLLTDVTPTALSQENPARSNLAAWLEGRSEASTPSTNPIMAREDTSPKFGTSIAEMAAEKRASE